MSTEPDEVPDVTGYLRTHVDCPHCDETVEIEGDASGDTVECDNCGCEMRVYEVK